MNTNRAEYLPHKGVMVEDVSSLLADVPGGNFIDATYGYGSHFKLSEKHNHLKFIGFDRDLESVKSSKTEHDVNHLNFSEIYNFLLINELLPISGILYDFGLSSHQIDSDHRGFSFQKNTQLDMRMDSEQKLTAEYILNNYLEEDLARVLKFYSEDKYYYRITKKIVESRPILTTNELVEIIKEAIPKQNPIYIEKTIRKIFQAIRIEVNNELNEIKSSLHSIKESIVAEGVIICISYHSLEDKIVKSFFKEITTDCICDPSFPICKCEIKQQFIHPKKKKYTPSENEKKSNTRSRSAIMRYVIKL
ncbi:MAG: 16S rRNA (cytosine(1402)-N(4))-methyltransferase RsmH [Candidatus Actinomarinales bacterium]|nr:MAG: 16S rRNA (cytosine(1402)-N(4))-methyltransferase RsmH [Candidatus Actinomarinales bacterium]